MSNQKNGRKPPMADRSRTTPRYAAIRQAVVDALAENDHRHHRRRLAIHLRALADAVEPGIGHGHGQPPTSGVRWNGHELLLGGAVWTAFRRLQRVTFDVAGVTTRIVGPDDGAYWVYAVCGRRGSRAAERGTSASRPQSRKPGCGGRHEGSVARALGAHARRMVAPMPIV